MSINTPLPKVKVTLGLVLSALAQFLIRSHKNTKIHKIETNNTFVLWQMIFG